MAFKLGLSIFDQDYVSIIKRQCKKSDLSLGRFDKEIQKELSLILSEIQKFEIPSRYVKRKLKGNIGHGIFLKSDEDPIKRGALIGPYSGKVKMEAQCDSNDGDYTFDIVTDLYLTKEEQKKFDPKKPFSPRRKYDLKLDASKEGNFTRFINHSSKPNVEAALVFSKNIGYQIFYTAKKKINPGEQLLASYEGEEDSYWKPLGIKPFPMDPKTFQVDAKLRLIHQ